MFSTVLGLNVATSTLVVAQELPWVVFLDDSSPSVCDVVHAENAELVVLAESGNLVLVTGTDVTLGDTLVDSDGNVLFEGNPAGVIDFQFDGDGFRTLWWTGLTGEVVQVDGFTGEPTPTTMRPDDFHNAACDACVYWDDEAACAEPEPEPAPSVTVCGQTILFPMMLSMLSLTALRLARGRHRVNRYSGRYERPELP
ncbi:MAG: hypothetical protein AABZ47_15795 [Planctomycetota bacterium]